MREAVVHTIRAGAEDLIMILAVVWNGHVASVVSDMLLVQARRALSVAHTTGYHTFGFQIPTTAEAPVQVLSVAQQQ